MEGKRSGIQPNNLLRKIGEFTRSIVEDLSNGRSPTISIDRFRNYCSSPAGNCFCSSDLSKGKEILTLQRECHAHRLDVLLRVLLIVQQLLQESRHGSKRDIYYMHPSVFSEQSVVDRAINDICILMQCSRHNLNVVSVGNGLVMGWLRFLEAGRKFDCINSPNTAHPVPVHVEDVKDIISLAKYILVVEKESVFQRLANDQFCSSNRCIIITGRGYPDIPTRRFLRLLVDELHLPAYCLVDCDPYGFDILTTYRFGSMQMAYDAKFLRVPEIRWLGAFPSDSEKYDLPYQCLLPLTAEDTRRTETMLLRCYLQREVPEWRLELELMLQRGVKFEIEALSVHSISFLSKEYLPSKIQVHISTRSWVISYATADIANHGHNPPYVVIFQKNSPKQTCVLKVNLNCWECKVKVEELFQSIYGIDSIIIDAERGTVKVSGRVDPNVLLMVLARSGTYAEILWVQIDKRNGQHSIHNNGYDYTNNYVTYGNNYTAQQQWYNNNNQALQRANYYSEVPDPGEYPAFCSVM